MTRYKHIFFDLDHTLWDFQKNAEETLAHLYTLHGLDKMGVAHADIFIEAYTRINNEMWTLYHRGQLDKQTLREKRFTDAFIALGVPPEKVPEGLWQQYLEICPTKTNLFPHAVEAVKYLHQRYTLSVLTNGFEETQHRKLHHSGLAPYITHLLTSEKAGYAKPDPRIFNRLLELNGAHSTETIMIGDNIEADIGGAIAAGMDSIYFNPEKTEHAHTIHIEIHSLQQLMELL